MKLIDLNLLLYAVNRDAPLHEQAYRWWAETLSGEEPVGLPWVVVLGFIRITTRPVVLPQPLTTEQAAGVVDEWLGQPPIVLVHPGDRHWEILKGLLLEMGTAANLTTDAHLAALALEQDAMLHTTDGDFDRFPEVRWVNPLS